MAEVTEDVVMKEEEEEDTEIKADQIVFLNSLNLLCIQM